MAEVTGYRWLTRQLAHTPRKLVQRVENGVVGPGTPDVYACVDGVSAWFEAKELVSRGRATPKIYVPREITASQPPWWVCARESRTPLYGIFNGRGFEPFVVTVHGLIASIDGLTESQLRGHETTLEAVFNRRLGA